MNISMPDEIIIAFPKILTIVQPYTYFLFWVVLILVLSGGLKMFNKGPNMRNGIIAALSILIMYLAYALIYRFKPIGLEEYLVLPLPFLHFEQDKLQLIVYKFNENGHLCFRELCSEVTSMLLLAFLVNQIYAFKPGNLKTPAWLVFRFFSTLIAIGVYYGVHKVLQKCLSFVPEGSSWEVLVSFAPIFVLGALLVTFTLALARKSMVNFFKEVNPTFVGLHGFYYTNRFGVQVTCAIWSTLALTTFAIFLQKVCVENQIDMYIPLTTVSPLTILFVAILFILWIFVGFML